MRAAIFMGPDRPVAIERVPDPEPAPGQVVLRIHRCGICGSDVHHVHDPHTPMRIGARFGHEFAGEVAALGKDVQGLRIGDRVAALPLTGCGHCVACLSGVAKFCAEKALQFGGFSEFHAVNARDAVALPQSLSFEDGALIEPLAVSLHGVVLARLQPDERVLVVGAGPIGLAVAFWARRLGAGRIAVAATSRLGEARAMEMGADVFLDPDQDMAEAAREQLGGAPDVVFDAVGRPGLLETAIACARFGGRIVSLGFCRERDSFIPFRATEKELQVSFSMVYSLAEFEQVARVLDTGVAAPRGMVTSTVGLDDFPATLDQLRTRGSQCKVMVAP